MRAMERIGILVGVFAFVMAAIYGFWTALGTEHRHRVGRRHRPDPRRPARAHDRLVPLDDAAPPRARPLGRPAAVTSTRSRATTASSARTAGGRCSSAPPPPICFLGLAVGWWLFIIGAFFAIPALVGWTFEYWKGQSYARLERPGTGGPPRCERRRSAPAELVEGVLLDAEVVGDLVHHGHGDLLAQVLDVVAHPGQRPAEEGDPVGQRALAPTSRRAR